MVQVNVRVKTYHQMFFYFSFCEMFGISRQEKEIASCVRETLSENR